MVRRERPGAVKVVVEDRRGGDEQGPEQAGHCREGGRVRPGQGVPRGAGAAARPGRCRGLPPRMLQMQLHCISNKAEVGRKRKPRTRNPCEASAPGRNGGIGRTGIRRPGAGRSDRPGFGWDRRPASAQRRREVPALPSGSGITVVSFGRKSRSGGNRPAMVQRWVAGCLGDSGRDRVRWCRSGRGSLGSDY